MWLRRPSLIKEVLCGFQYGGSECTMAKHHGFPNSWIQEDQWYFQIVPKFFFWLGKMAQFGYHFIFSLRKKKFSLKARIFLWRKESLLQREQCFLLKKSFIQQMKIISWSRYLGYCLMSSNNIKLFVWGHSWLIWKRSINIYISIWLSVCVCVYTHAHTNTNKGTEKKKFIQKNDHLCSL